MQQLEGGWTWRTGVELRCLPPTQMNAPTIQPDQDVPNSCWRSCMLVDLYCIITFTLSIAEQG